MDRQIKKYLQDIIDSINAINVHLQGKREYRIYLSNLTMQRSVEREIEIIGEAMSRILKLSPEIKISFGKKIVGQRNLIIHAYDAINNEMIWNVVVNYLPKLKEEVAALLGEVL
jgi:uncharacterized protein with HEPN domain